MHPDSTTSFSERLHVPLRWWFMVLFFVASAFVAVAFYLGPLNGLIVSVVLLGLVVAVLIPFGRLRIAVDDEALAVGNSRIEWQWVAGARALDAEASRRRLGPGADARAHLATRPYLNESVEVTLADPADPHPYWLIGSRAAGRLADAINAHTGQRADAVTQERVDDQS